jgi:hypothetical protein
MHKSFTLEDVARYSLEVFAETQANTIKASQRSGPSVLALQNILQYSKALRVSTTGSGGPLFLIMN